MDNAVRGRILSQGCPSRKLLRHITGRWALLILLLLHTGSKRFSALRRNLEGISERILTQNLQQLERDGLVLRVDFHCIPPHVEYQLTPWGREASERILPLVDWLESNWQAILAFGQSLKPENTTLP